MNFTYLKYFFDTVKEKSFLKASKINFVSQPAISQGVRKLEEELELNLLHHQKNQIKPTKQGMEVFNASRELFIAIKDYQQKINEIKGDSSGKITIGISSSLVPHILIPVLTEFSKKHTNIDIIIKVLSTPNQIEELEKGNIDFGITINNGKLQNYHQKILKKGKFKIISKSKSPQKLLLTEKRPETILLENEIESFNNSIDLVRIESWRTISELIKSNYGCGFIPDYLYQKKSNLIDITKKFTSNPISYEVVSFSNQDPKESKLLSLFYNFY